jgi:hypothetical protein
MEEKKDYENTIKTLDGIRSAFAEMDDKELILAMGYILAYIKERYK